MHHTVSHTDDLAPWDIRMASPEIVRDAGRGFTDNLHKMDERELHDLVSVEAISSLRRLLFQLFCCLAHITHPLPVAPHSVTASARMRACIRFFSRFGVATWVNTPMSCSTSRAKPVMSK